MGGTFIIIAVMVITVCLVKHAIIEGQRKDFNQHFFGDRDIEEKLDHPPTPGKIPEQIAEKINLVSINKKNKKNIISRLNVLSSRILKLTLKEINYFINKK